MNIFNDPNRIPENYGLRIAAGLIGYFLIMEIFGLAYFVELRYLNVVVLAIGVFYALRKFRHTHDENLEYFRALVTGVAASSIGCIIFSLFLFIYMKFDTSMMQYIRDNEPMGQYLNPYMAAFVVALEGVFSGLLVTFILINYSHPTKIKKIDENP